MHAQRRMLGVRRVRDPRYLADEHVLDSVWSTEQAARPGGQPRRHLLGQVRLICWRMDDTGSRHHLGTSVEGELASALS